MATKKASGSTGKKTATKTTKTPSAIARAAAEAAVTAVPIAESVKKAPTHEDVAQLAQQYWIERGRPYGSAEVDWLKAEATLHA